MVLSGPAWFEPHLARAHEDALAAYDVAFNRLDASMLALAELPQDVPEAPATRRARWALLDDIERDMEESRHLAEVMRRASDALGQLREAGPPRGDWFRATMRYLVRQKTEAAMLEAVAVLAYLKGDVGGFAREGLRMARHALDIGWAAAPALRALPAHATGPKAAELKDIADAVRVAGRLLEIAQAKFDVEQRAPPESRPLTSCVSLPEIVFALGARACSAFIWVVRVRARAVSRALHGASHGLSAAAWNLEAIATEAMGRSQLDRR